MTSFSSADDLVLHLILPPYTLDDPRLVLGEIYVGIQYESWRVGPMTSQWYGWLWANGHGPGTQANHIDGPLYRFDPEQYTSTMFHKPPPPTVNCPVCLEPRQRPGSKCDDCGNQVP